MRISDFTSPCQGALSLMPHHKHKAEFYTPESHIQIIHESGLQRIIYSVFSPLLLAAH